MKKKLLISMLSLSLFATTAFGASCFAYAGTTCPEDCTPSVIAPASVRSQSTQSAQTADETLEIAALTAKGTTAKAVSKSTTAKTTTAKAASTKKNPTAKQVLKSLKKSLGKSYTSDQKETKERLESYWGLNMKKVVSWAAEGNSSSSLNSDCVIILKVKKGYAKKAAAKLQEGYEQIVSYNRMYDMDTQRVLQARLYVNGNYVALIIEGQKPDYNDSAEAQAKFAAKEGKKIDKAWKKIFGSAKNKIKIPKDDGSQKGFDMSELEASAQ